MAKLRKSVPFMATALEADKCIIQPKSTTKEGRHFCADCGTIFENNLMAGLHAPSHRVGWWTGEHAEER
jgi:hypothetical protein